VHCISDRSLRLPPDYAIRESALSLDDDGFNVANASRTGLSMMIAGQRLGRRRGEGGQVIVVMALGLLAAIVAVGVVIDGGNAWAKQRVTQNGADAAAEAGATVMASRLAGAAAPADGWDAVVSTQVQANAAANGVSAGAAYYTDICGIPLQADGTAALNADGTENLAVADQVGSGSLPAVINTTPDCPSRVVGPPAGVLVLTQEDVSTYVAPIVGINSFHVAARATAVAGYLQGQCGAADGAFCSVLPIAIPVDVTTCDGSNNAVDTGAQWNLYQLYIVPICTGSAAGNVGFIDWTPPGGGDNEIAQEINNPNNPPIVLPHWEQVGQTGKQGSQSIQDALRNYDGQVILVPQFDLSCSGQPSAPDSSQPAVTTAPNYGCPSAEVGGNGNKMWYRMPSFAYFQLCSSTQADCVAAGTPHGAYTSGNDKATCNTGNGATECLAGRFVSILASGLVGPGVGGGTSNNKTLGVQLIK
jgi:hypothetical protein